MLLSALVRRQLTMLGKAWQLPNNHNCQKADGAKLFLDRQKIYSAYERASLVTICPGSGMTGGQPLVMKNRANI